MKDKKTISEIETEEAIRELKKLYPLTCKMVNGILKGGFEDHDSRIGMAIDKAISSMQRLVSYEEIGDLEECRKAIENAGSILLFQNEEGTWDKVPEHQLTIYFKTEDEMNRFADDLKKNRFNDSKEKFKGMSIDELELSVRTRNCLIRCGISTIGELCERSQGSLAKERNMGRRSIEEIENKLSAIGLSLRHMEDESCRLEGRQ